MEQEAEIAVLKGRSIPVVSVTTELEATRVSVIPISIKEVSVVTEEEVGIAVLKYISIPVVAVTTELEA